MNAPSAAPPLSVWLLAEVLRPARAMMRRQLKITSAELLPVYRGTLMRSLGALQESALCRRRWPLRRGPPRS